MINGLSYIADYINSEAQAELINQIDAQPWLADLKRRTQHYGYKYDYTKKKIDSSLYLGRLPDWIQPLADRLLVDGIFTIQPDQVIINEYLPGQGISKHIDCKPCFDGTIASLSLGSTCVMEFEKYFTDDRYALLLEAGSLLVLQQEARYDWAHSIPSRKFDTWNGAVLERDRRVSITFRKVIHEII